jgi:hypothetical protein
MISRVTRKQNNNVYTTDVSLKYFNTASVGIVIRLQAEGLNSRGSKPGKDKRLSSSP